MSQEVQQPESGMAFFPSPEAAVPIIAEFLRKEEFRELARYYDLTDSGIERSELESGDFFVRKERPKVAHPAGFWRYKHPFSPGFKYSYESPGSRKNVYVIHLSIEIDQGADSPAQLGLDSFYMIRSDKGWQILPGSVDEPDEVPVSASELMPAPSWK